MILPDLSPAARARNLDLAAGNALDMLVIGGGINGACVARDAAMRGLKVALVEQGYFASGTSSKSSKLIHGGLRYLEHLEFGLVFESLQERGTLLALAPNLVRPLEFVFPVYAGDKVGMWKLDAGLWAYDVMSMFRKVKRHHKMTPKKVAAAVPGLLLDGLKGAVAYDDAGTDDASLTSTILRSAAHHGALLATRARVTGLIEKDGRVAGAHVLDVASGRTLEMKARSVVNVAGPWIDAVRKMAKPDARVMLRPTKGAHLAFLQSRWSVDRAVVLSGKKDKRIVFVIPWLGYTLLGTTDTDHTGDPGDVSVTKDDVAYLLEIANHYFPGVNLTPGDVTGAMAGLRPLLNDPGASKPSDVSRRYTLIEEPKGLFTLTGGKLTTARRMAADTIDLVVKKSGLKAKKCRTDKEPLLEDIPLAKLEAELARTPGLAPESVAYLSHCYGSDARAVLALAKDKPELAQRIADGHPQVKAQVPFAFQHEMIDTADAFLDHYGKGGLTCAAGAREAVERELAAIKEGT